MPLVSERVVFQEEELLSCWCENIRVTVTCSMAWASVCVIVSVHHGAWVLRAGSHVCDLILPLGSTLFIHWARGSSAPSQRVSFSPTSPATSLPRLQTYTSAGPGFSGPCSWQKQPWQWTWPGTGRLQLQGEETGFWKLPMWDRDTE